MKSRPKNNDSSSTQQAGAGQVDTATLNSARAFQLSQAALADAKDLAKLAEEDKGAAETLHTVASQVAQMWTDYCAKHPESAAQILPTKFGFPCNYPLFCKERERLDAWVKRLRLGMSSSPILGGDRQRDLDRLSMQIATRWVIAIKHALLDLRRAQLESDLYGSVLGEPHIVRVDLPEGAENKTAGVWREWQLQVLGLGTSPFNSKNAPAWAKIIWKGIMLRTDGRPESVPELRELGQRRAEHSVQTGAQRKATPKTAASNIRDGIRTRITDAVRKLAIAPT
jgi:hypothetical protein